MAEYESPPSGSGWTPIPDPTLLTSTAVSAAKEDLRRELVALRELIQMQLDQRLATQEQRFVTVANQFAALDARHADSQGTTRLAITTALNAAKEMTTMQNLTVDKRLDQIVGLLNTTTGALDNKIGLLTEQAKTTMTRQEVEQLFRTIMDKLDGPTGLSMRLENVIARGLGQSEQVGRNTQQNQWMIGAVIGGMALLIALAVALLKP